MREFDRGTPLESAFRYAMFKLRNDSTLLSQTKLKYDIQFIEEGDSFTAASRGLSSVFLVAHRYCKVCGVD